MKRVSVSSVIFRFMLHLTVPIPGQIRFCSSLMRTTSQKQLPDARRMRSPQPDSSGATRYTNGTIIRAQVMHGGCYVWLTCLNCTILSASTISADLMNIIPSRSVIRRQSAATGKKDRAWTCSIPSKKKLGDVDVIAEDLGYLTESVIEMVKRVRLSWYEGAAVCF